MENQRHRQQPEKTLRICERMHVCGHSLWGLMGRGGQKGCHTEERLASDQVFITVKLI